MLFLIIFFITQKTQFCKCFLCRGNPRVRKDGCASGYAPEVILCTYPVASDAFLSFRATIFSLFGGGFNLRIHRQHETRQVKHFKDII